MTKLITTADCSPLTRRTFCRAGIVALPGLFAGNGFAQEENKAKKADGATAKKPVTKELTAEEKAAAKKAADDKKTAEKE